MAYIDGNKSASSIIDKQYDVTIIGAGAAGVMLASILSKKKKKVLLVETGRFGENEQMQKLNAVVQTGKFLRNAIWGRKRAIGGTTIAWGGQSLPFEDHDFQKKEWVLNSGWPLKKAELEEHYNQANSFMKVDLLDYQDDIFRLLRKKPLLLKGEELFEHFSKWSPSPNFIKSERNLHRHVDILYNVTATDFIFEKNTVKRLKVKNHLQEEHVLDTNQLVIAAGAIESVRLLLLNSKSKKESSPISSEWLGKCFMDHPCIEVGTISLENTKKLQKRFSTQFVRSKKYSVRLSLSKKFIYSKKLLSASASIMFAYKDPTDNPYFQAKKAICSKRPMELLALLKKIGTFFKIGKHLLFDQFIYRPNSKAVVTIMAEQEPIKESYLSLCNEKDIFDVEKIRVNWQISSRTWESIIELARAISEEFDAWDMGQMNIYPQIRASNPEWETLLSDVNHHMGGSRMSDSKEDGVVDKDLKVWGVENLFVCSCSVFPTSSHSNPTLTLLALASRLAEKFS